MRVCVCTVAASSRIHWRRTGWGEKGTPTPPVSNIAGPAPPIMVVVVGQNGVFRVFLSQ